MPITPFLNDENFDLETTRVMGVALEMACLGLRTGDGAKTKQARKTHHRLLATRHHLT